MSEAYNTPTADLAMTLSSLAYVDETKIVPQQQMIDDINADLQGQGYPSWQVAWGPILNADRSNLLYAARNSDSGELAVVVRGSDFSFWLDWLEDLATIALVPYRQFVPTVSPTAQIAFGTALGLQQLLALQDGSVSLQAFLMQAPDATPILITGHSLGGCLASALAPCVAHWLGGGSGLSVYTFAAPSPGNQDFATYYNRLFTDDMGDSAAFRFFNSLDVVPNGWASLAVIETYYAGLVSCPSDISDLIGYVQQAVGGMYTQLGELAVGSAIALPGAIIEPFSTGRQRRQLSPIEDALFLWEAAQQHGCDTYQALLQAPMTVPGIGRLKRALAR